MSLPLRRLAAVAGEAAAPLKALWALFGLQLSDARLAVAWGVVFPAPAATQLAMAHAGKDLRLIVAFAVAPRRLPASRSASIRLRSTPVLCASCSCASP